MVALVLVTPPWLPLAMVGVLLAVLGFLYWSMRRNIGRIDIDERTGTGAPSSPVSPVSPPPTGRG